MNKNHPNMFRVQLNTSFSLGKVNKILISIIISLVLCATLLNGQECKLAPKGEKVFKKFEHLKKLAGKLLCAHHQEGGNEDQEEETEVTKGHTTTPKIIETTQMATTLATKDMCDRPFSPASETKSRMVHCWMHSHQQKGLMAKHLNPDLCTHVELMRYFEVDKDYNFNLIAEFMEEFQSLSKLFKPKKIPLILSLGKYDEFTGFHYSNLTGDETSRKKFAAGVMEAMTKYDLGGFFVHWVYPVRGQWKRITEEFKTYPKLMKLLSEKLKEKNLVLYALGPPSILDFSDSFDIKKLKDTVDLWLFPSFHFEGAWSRYTAIASPIKRLADSMDYYSKIIPREKLVFGIPSYMSPSSLKDLTKTKLGSPHTSNSDKFQHFKVLCEEVAKGGVTIVHNETGQINSYAFKDDDWVSYDSGLVIMSKVELVKKKNVAGLYLAFLGDDDIDGRACKCGKFYLLRTINEGLRGDGSCVPPICP